MSSDVYGRDRLLQRWIVNAQQTTAHETARGGVPHVPPERTLTDFAHHFASGAD